MLVIDCFKTKVDFDLQIYVFFPNKQSFQSKNIQMQEDEKTF